MTESGLSARTVRYVHAILTSAFSQAVKWQMLSVNPCNAVILPRQQKNEMKAFSPDESKRFLQSSKDDKHGLPENLFKDLKAHKRRQAEAMLKLGQSYERNNLVFTTGKGKPLYLRNLRKRHFQKILEKADLKGFRLYDLSHSTATLLLSAGINPKIVSERLGHASIILTLDTYSHVLPDMQKEASLFYLSFY
jgi:integrase